MIGKHWTVGIALSYRPGDPPSWSGSLEFMDEPFVDGDPQPGPVSTAGHLRTFHPIPAEPGHQRAIRAITDTLIEDAGRMGIEFHKPWLYLEDDGEDPAQPPPMGWRQLLDSEARRLGWEFLTREDEP